jgi:predicted nucleic acid-binding protein
VLGTALAIGLKHNLAIYDSLYIALALRSRNAFVTLDARQGRAATAEGVTVIPITNFK